MQEVFPDYPKPDRPVHFVIYEGENVLAIGLPGRFRPRRRARTTGPGNTGVCPGGHTIRHSKGLLTKVIFLNDGPGLLLGSMWNDYAHIEESWPGRVKVLTLRMVPERIDPDWLRSKRKKR